MSSVENEVSIPIIRPRWLNITEQPVVAIDQLSSGEWLLGLSDGKVRVVDSQEGKTHFENQSHKMGLINLVAHSEKPLVMSYGEDNTLLLQIYHDQKLEELKKWKGKQWISSALWVNDDLVFTCGKQLFVWPEKDAEPRLIETWQHSPTSLSLSARGDVGVAGYSRLSLYTWPEMSLAKSYEWKGSLENLKFCSRHRFAACSSQDLTIHIWDLKKDKDLAMRGFPEKILDMSFRKDGLYLANCSANEIMIWDFMEPGPAGKRPTVLGPFEKPIEKVSYQHSGKMLASFGQDGVILFWRPDLFDDQPIAIAGIREQSILTGKWSLDDRSVVSGLKTGYAACYDAPEVTTT